MPLLSMSADGRIFEADSTRHDGGGFGRDAYDVDDTTDVAISSAAKLSDDLRQRQALENTAHKKVVAKMEARKKLEKDAAKRSAKRAAEVRDYQHEFAVEENLGVDPLYARAKAQQMSGVDYEQYGVAGFGTSGDGSHDPDALSGFSTMGFTMPSFISDIIGEDATSVIEAAGGYVEENPEQALSLAMQAGQTVGLVSSGPNVDAQKAAAAQAQALTAQKRAAASAAQVSALKDTLAKNKTIIFASLAGVAVLGLAFFMKSKRKAA